MENVFHVQNHFKSIPPAKMRSAVHQGMVGLYKLNSVYSYLESAW